MKRMFPSLPDDAKLVDVFRRFPSGVVPLLEMHDRVLRDDGPLTVAERELIAAYTSSLNACTFCFEAHVVFARAHGIDPDLIAAILDDPESDAVADTLRPILAFTRKLTLSPSKMTEADAKAVYDAGWSEEALMLAVKICGIFNLMNRIVEASGVLPYEAKHDDTPATDLPRMDSYSDVANRLGLK